MNAEPTQRSILQRLARRAMSERGFLVDFSRDAGAQAAAAAPASGDVPGVVDLRALPWCSIDNDDSRDLDQLSTAREAPGGGVEVLVAVADVDAVVTCDSAVDAHARHNTTSVYTPAEVFPMLPERLSTDVTSLGQGVDRLALVISFVVREDGSVEQESVQRAVVRNKAKLAYDAVGAWFEGRREEPGGVGAVPGLRQSLRWQDQAAQALRARRRASGALELDSRESHVVLDGDTIAAVRALSRDRAKDLIEDFMVAANGVAMRVLAARGFPSIRRVVRTPRRWERIVELAAALGGELPVAPDPRALAAFLAVRKAADPLRFADLSLAVVKLLGPGEYVAAEPGPEAPGHFGLAVRDYGHFTAPNRRFADLATHRLLKAALAGTPPPYAAPELAEIALACTRREDDANKVERQVRKSAAALLLAGQIGRRFAAIVTGAAAKGTWVRIVDPPVEGRVVRGESGLDVGDRVEVRLLATDVDRGFIDFARVGAAID